MNKVNKKTNEPLYQQLIEIIKEQINTGKLKTGDQIPTEAELSERYNVSRITVRKAIELLAEDDILIKKQGIGTFVTAKKLKRDSARFMGYTEHCRQVGVEPGATLIVADLMDAGLIYTEQLNLADGEKIIRVSRIRTADDEPVMIEENYFPARFAYLLGEDLTGSLYQILEANGVHAATGYNRFSICYAEQDEARYLNISKNEALILWKGLCLDNKGNPLHAFRNKVNPKKYEITICSK